MRAMRSDGFGAAVEVGWQVGHWQQSVWRFSGRLIARRRGAGNGVVPGLRRVRKLPAASNVGAAGVTMRRFAWSRKPCRPARLFVGWRGGMVWHRAYCSHGRHARAARVVMPCQLLFLSRSLQRRVGIDQRAATGVFTACAAIPVGLVTQFYFALLACIAQCSGEVRTRMVRRRFVK